MLASEILSVMDTHDLLEELEFTESKTKQQELEKLWKEADEQTKQPKNIILTIPDIKILDVHEPFYDKSGEIYVISQVTSGALDDKTKSYTTYTTQTFHQVKKNDLLGLGRNGMVIWAGDVSGDQVNGKDPKQFIDFHIAVMESDKKSRDIASDLKKFKDAVKLDEIDKAIQGLSTVDPTQFSHIFNLTKIAFELIILGLKNDKDDVVGNFHDSLLRHQNYSPGRYPKDPTKLQKAGDVELAYNVIVS